MDNIRLLIINPGSTSTKIGVYDNEELILEKTLRHSTEEIEKFDKIVDQYEFRMNIITSTLEENNISLESLNGIIGRGGLLKPIHGGTYEVNACMLNDLKIGVQGEHASNLGGIIAHAIAEKIGKKAYIVDPVVVDEMEPIAKITGIKELEKRSIWHALNQKAVARRFCKSKNQKYEDLNLIVAHMGGGISVSAHRKGQGVDVPNALDGDGPFSPERSGTLPVGDLVRLCYSGKYSKEEVLKMVKGKGGLVSYLGTNNAKEVGDRGRAGDEYADLVYRAMAYQVAKEIGAEAAVLHGKVDAIILTGGIAYDEVFCSWIEEKVKFIAPVVRYPGEDELLALCEGGLRVLRGEEEAKVYE